MLRELNRPLRILMTLDAVGGVWRYAMSLANGLSASGVDILFVGLGPRPSPTQRREAERLGSLHWLDLPLDWLATDPEELAQVSPALAELAARRGVDLIHLNLPSQASKLDADCPVVVVSHSCLVTWSAAVRSGEMPADWLWQRRLNAAGFEAADVVLAPSRSHGAMLEASYGPLPRLAVIPNATRPVGGTAQKQPFILAAGRWWDEGKNGATLDAAAAFTDWPVLMAGALAGPNGGHCEIHNARALGELEGTELGSFIGRAAIVASPSIYEPFGLVALEAASAGAALVLADIPTYRELWSGAAVFVPPRDASAWAVALNELAVDPKRRTLLGSRAADRARRFSPEAQRDAMLAVYTSALHARPKPLQVA